MAEHTESRWVAFTQYTTGGRTWNVTLREGVDADLIDDMLAQIADATNRIATVADAVQPKAQEAVGSPQGNGGSRNTGGGVFGARSGSQGASGPSSKVPSGPQVSDVSKVVITGTRDAPMVEMYSPNEKLKFPVFKVPAARVQSLLRDRYPMLGDDDLGVFEDCGYQFPVTWTVQWEPSPKNPKWKDLITIIQADLEQ